MFDSIEVLAIAYQQLFYGHCGFLMEGVLTIILLGHLGSGRRLSGTPSDLDELLNDILCGHSAVDGQEGFLQSLETLCVQEEAATSEPLVRSMVSRLTSMETRQPCMAEKP
ncbi:hypothetical protein EYF80_033495 [Liparis tanakae]|uniref:Uncharacterized protein n=1 Tax=Liparis tanakae TaxID=230148 RepID=A0A4Z2GSC4_9TELE|nr:hypothetical protein EYF80_033495 [Liparis tanakae]